MLAENPGLGRPCEEVRLGLRRFEQGKPVVFYREEANGVLICRSLHERMLAGGHVIDDEDDDRSAGSGSAS